MSGGLETLLWYLGENSFTSYVTVNFQFYFLSDFYFLVVDAMKFKCINSLFKLPGFRALTITASFLE